MKKIIYQIRQFLFLICFFPLYTILGSLMEIGLIGYLFLFLFFLYAIKNTLDFLSKKKKYQQDLIYNLMQIGIFLYIGVMYYKIYYDNVIPTIKTISYFKTNYIILSLLLIFIFLYRFEEMDNKYNMQKLKRRIYEK